MFDSKPTEINQIIDWKQSQKVTALLKAINNRERRSIVDYILERKRLQAKTIATELRIKPDKTALHILVLLKNEILYVEAENGKNFYRVNYKTLEKIRAMIEQVSEESLAEAA